MKKLLLLQIALAIVLLVLIILYVTQNQSNYLPFTKVYLSNTTVVGRLLGVG